MRRIANYATDKSLEEFSYITNYNAFSFIVVHTCVFLTVLQYVSDSSSPRKNSFIFSLSISFWLLNF